MRDAVGRAQDNVAVAAVFLTLVKHLARRIIFAGEYSVERLLHWRAVAAIEALHSAGGSVHFDDQVGV